MAHGLPAVPAPGAKPRLFDVAAMPDFNATCPHCNGPWDILFCCGVCVLEHRFCEQKWPGKGVSDRVLKVLLRKGFPLGDLTPCELFLRIRGRWAGSYFSGFMLWDSGSATASAALSRFSAGVWQGGTLAG